MSNHVGGRHGNSTPCPLTPTLTYRRPGRPLVGPVGTGHWAGSGGGERGGTFSPLLLSFSIHTFNQALAVQLPDLVSSGSECETRIPEVAPCLFQIGSGTVLSVLILAAIFGELFHFRI